jgi:hypothetical protein
MAIMGVAMPYLRTTIGKWNIDLNSEEASAVFQRVKDEGLRVFRSQPGFIRYRLGFIRYRLMKADPHTTVAVAEWESEDLGKAGARRFRAWLNSSGIAEKVSLETYDGEIVVAS